MSDSVLFAFGLTLFAGLATGGGSAIALLAKKTNTKFLSASLGFSAGVMIYVSLVEIFVKARHSLEAAMGESKGCWITAIASVAGIMVFISLDELLPTAENYGEHHIAIYGLVIGMAVMALSLLMFV